MRCGYIMHAGGGAPQDCEGCTLLRNHPGPHLFVAQDGRRWEWEYDVVEGCDVYWAATPIQKLAREVADVQATEEAAE